MTARHRLVRVPASSANLGPGYDVMAAAVSLHLELEVEETGEFSLDPGGLEVSTGRDNLVVRAFESLHPADGIAFRLRSEIPLARGLGSSAAAIVAGLFAADHLFELALSKEEMLARATELEGHPDNVAAAIYGGFVVCGADADGAPLAARFDPPEGLEGIVVIPPEEVSTKLAREAIPAEVPLADAVANVSAAALLVLGLRSADLDLVAARPRRPHPPAAPPRALPALDGDRRRGGRAGRAGGDDLRRRARPSSSGPPGRTPATSPRRWSSAAPAGPRSAACRSPPSAPTSPSSEMDWVVQIGLIELALGGLLGWAMVIRQEQPEWLTRIGVVAPQRIRQVHLDYVMMGLILIGVGLAVPDLPTAIAAALVFGTARQSLPLRPPRLRPGRGEARSGTGRSRSSPSSASAAASSPRRSSAPRSHASAVVSA